MTRLSLKGRCRWPLSTPRMTFPSPACALVSSLSTGWVFQTWVMLPPRVFVLSQLPKSIRWRRLRPPRREGVAGVDELRLQPSLTCTILGQKVETCCARKPNKQLSQK